MHATVWRTGTPAAAAASGVATKTTNRAARGLWLAALLVPWALLIRRLGLSWEADPQYAYAWSVPFLAAVLAVLRWPGQPALQPSRHTGGGWLIFFGAALVFPIRLLQEAAPDWSVANWSFALVVAFTTFAFLGRTGGWRWAGWFLFPLLFLLTAVPWPQRFDLWLTQALMRNVAAVTVELLGWFNLPAVRQGNLICLTTGAVGVDEACSGIRSLQAMLMVALFLGDLWRLRAGHRFALVAAGLGLAFVGNVVRTTLLSTVAARAGVDAIHAWHDPAGFGILCFGLAGCWLLGARWRRPVVPPPAPDVTATAQVATPPRLPILPAAISAGLILALLASEAAVGFWFGRHETGAPPTPLAVAWPTHDPAFHPVAIPDAARRILLCSEGEAAAWRDPAEREWSLYHLRWAPGTTSTQSARLHRPETCLEASGALLMADFGRQEVSVPGGSLSFQGYLFQKEGKPLYVLFALHEQRPADRDPAAMLQDWSGWSRVQRAVAGQRNLGQESVEIVMSPSASAAGPEDPMAVMRGRLQQLVSFPSAARPNP